MSRIGGVAKRKAQCDLDVLGMHQGVAKTKTKDM